MFDKSDSDRIAYDDDTDDDDDQDDEDPVGPIIAATQQQICHTVKERNF